MLLDPSTAELVRFFQTILSGLTLGSVYGAIALGIILIYNVTGVLNLAQGEFLVLGGLSMLTLWEHWAWPFPLAFLGALFLCALLGWTMQRFVLKPAWGASIGILFIITLAIAIVLRGLFLLVWGNDPKSMPSMISRTSLDLWGVKIPPDSLLVFGMLIVLTIFIWFFFQRTNLGKALRASSENPRAAEMIGINVERSREVAFILAGLISGIAGILIAPITFLSFDSGLMIGLKGLVASLIGGVSNPYAGLLGGLVLGLLEALTTGYISSLFQNATVFLVLLLMLAIRTVYRLYSPGSL